MKFSHYFAAQEALQPKPMVSEVLQNKPVICTHVTYSHLCLYDSELNILGLWTK